MPPLKTPPRRPDRHSRGAGHALPAMGVLVSTAAAMLLLLSPAAAILTFRDTPDGRNIAPPTGRYANSGWQYEGKWGGFLGTAIAPYYFITAKHVGGGVGQSFLLGGKSYTAVECFPSPRGDLAIWRVREPMPIWAPLYFGEKESGAEIVVYGRGSQRGTPVTIDRQVRGWRWGASDGVESWGTNRVNVTGLGELLPFTFDEHEGENECSLSGGDSGGGVFLNENGVWKLAGVNYAVAGFYSTHADGDGQFPAALYDSRGFYCGTDKRFTYLSPGLMFAQPSTSLATRICANRYFIESVLAGRRGDLGTHPLSRRQAAALLGILGVVTSAVLAISRHRRQQRRRRTRGIQRPWV